MRNRRIFLLFLALILLCTASLTAAAATAVELTATDKAALGKTITAAAAAEKAVINKLYQDLITLQQLEQSRDSSIKSVHIKNEEALLTLRRDIKLIDVEKLKLLDKAVQQARERYKPLFALYTALNKQIAAVKKLKIKELNALLSAQADAMKLAVQAARQEIKARESLLQAAKNHAKAAKKRIQETLSAITFVKIRIKAERNAASTTKKHIGPQLKMFKQAVKKTNVEGTLESLPALVAQVRHIVARKGTILDLENQISAIIDKAKAQLPSKR
ncbi:hypothetical protein K0T92_15190 [Paenibacillus oenotherae]|uniref:Uncharacterized protein n=1 Tax=Paenibacillus oenotherae TaxID=1435645 RepID=A0ABS7D822_9BACL|nr:hypothetical protein [Paenibacillus oenotherae]MBW7476089.1 hypothetical protein [Paenibacillus oenotherae]